MADSQTKGGKEQAEQSEIKRKLIFRVGFAGLMIVLLLGTLAVFDHMNAPEEIQPAEPRFTEPVPVAKKEITQPVTPAEPDPEPASAPEGEAAPAGDKVAAPEDSAAPVDKTVLPSGPPPRPEVAAQPQLPRAARIRPAAEPTPVARDEASEPAPPAARPAPAVRAAPPPTAPPPAAVPGVRLFSGYALQAGVFSDTRRAEELRAQLTLNGIPSTIESRVHVGPFKTREEAETARAKMKALGIDALLLPPKGAARR